ncbi:flagellin [Synergistales bacterium]|nr:flagellin [Synergistales bacterium]
MRIYHNIPALYAYNALNDTNNQLQKSIRNLSTGLRINSAADDAAGLAISEKMRAQISGLNMAVRNAQDAISMLQTGEGALTETHSMLQRMRELAVQAANDTLAQQDRQYIQQEIDQLKEEINRIANTTQFNKKRLLNGSGSAIWSASDLSTKAYVRGTLRQVDQFGQKAAFEGNYRISINADPGQAETLKTDIFKIKHPNVIMSVGKNTEAGIQDIRVDNLPAGTYRVTGQSLQVDSATGWTNASTQIVGYYSSKNVGLSAPDGSLGLSGLGFAAATNSSVNASVLLEVSHVDTGSTSITVRITTSVLSVDGKVSNYVQNSVLFTNTGTSMMADAKGDTKLGFELSSYGLSNVDLKNIAVGDKVVYNVTAGTSGTKAGATANTLVTISGSQTESWDYKWPDTTIIGPGLGTTVGSTVSVAGRNVTENPLKFALDATAVKNSEVHFRNFYLNTNNGKVYEGNIVLTTNDNFDLNATATTETNLASFEAAYIGQIAKSDVKLRDLDKFWNTQGVFMLNDPQTLLISQGNGKNTSITLYSTDTLEGFRSKLNAAIADGLLQDKYATGTGAAAHFVSFVEENAVGSTGEEIQKHFDNTAESVPGTFIIRTLIAGDGGKLSFSGDEDLINALSLNVVQQAKENSFSVSVYDAHNSTIIASDVRMSGNLMVGIIHPNVDVEFDPMANIDVKWNENTRSFTLTKQAKPTETILHLVDNSTVFQVGANENEDVAVDMGNMSADALGVSRVIVTNRESAGRAITILDAAISRVSSQRAKIGAYQNAMEHTITNLTTTATNLTAAESRIRDADMSKEMLNFTRLQILMQSGTSMLAQANQLPQTVLSLIRG